MRNDRLVAMTANELLELKNKHDSWHAVAGAIGCHYISLMRKKKELLGYDDVFEPNLSAEELAELKKQHRTWKATADFLGTSEPTLIRYAQKIGCEAPNADKKCTYECDDNYFESIDTEEKAYYLGLYLGDGTISKNCVKFGLKTEDRDHVLTFKTALNFEGKISDIVRHMNGKEYFFSEFSLTSRKMVADLLALGITENKSLTVKSALKIDHPLFKHYARGVFDADGCVCVTAGSANAKEWAVSFNGSYDVVKTIANWIALQLNYPKEPHANGNIFAATYTGCALPQSVVRLIYDDAVIYLPRKHAIIQQLLAQQPLRRDWSHLTVPMLKEMKERLGTWKAVAIELEMDESQMDDTRKRLGGEIAPAAMADYSHITREVIEEAIEKHGSLKNVALAFGMAESTLWKLKRDRFGITDKKHKVPQNIEALVAAKNLSESDLVQLLSVHENWKAVAKAIDIHQSALNNIRRKIGGAVGLVQRAD